MKKQYVTMTDTFLSGWGEADGKKAVFVYECDSLDEAHIVRDNAKARGDQKNVTVCGTKPQKTNTRKLIFKSKEDSPNWYKEGYWKKSK